jgi:hypothetical protein
MRDEITKTQSIIGFVFLRVAIPLWFKKSSIELPSEEECDARGDAILIIRWFQKNNHKNATCCF